MSRYPAQDSCKKGTHLDSEGEARRKDEGGRDAEAGLPRIIAIDQRQLNEYGYIFDLN